jgi:uncharacterized protein
MPPLNRSQIGSGRTLCVLLLLLCVFYGAGGGAALAAEPKFPALTGRVVDEATLISPTARDRITRWLEDFERASGKQVVVLTVKGLQGYPIEDFGYRLGRAWGIGEKDKNTGAILLVAPQERAVRIEVGYGLEGELTDAASRAIIEQTILPAFRQGNYELGIINGTVAILRVLGWQGDAPGVAAITPDAQEGLPPIIIFIFIILFILLRFGWSGIFTGRHGPGVWGARSRGGFTGGGGSFGGGGASGRW